MVGTTGAPDKSWLNDGVPNQESARRFRARHPDLKVLPVKMPSDKPVAGSSSDIPHLNSQFSSLKPPTAIDRHKHEHQQTADHDGGGGERRRRAASPLSRSIPAFRRKRMATLRELSAIRAGAEVRSSLIGARRCGQNGAIQYRASRRVDDCIDRVSRPIPVRVTGCKHRQLRSGELPSDRIGSGSCADRDYCQSL